MKIITRHLLREFIVPLTLCLSTFIVLFVVFDLFDHISWYLEAQTPLRLIVLYYLYIIVPMLQFLAPASLMLAALYSLWRLSRSNELVAMRASGVSILTVLKPFLAVSILASIALLAMQETFVPTTYEWAMTLRQNKYRPLEERVVQDAYYISQREHRQWRIGSFDMLHPETLHDVKVAQESPDRRNLYKLTAPKAEYLDGQWWFYAPMIQRYGDTDNPIGGPAPLGSASNSIVQVRALTENPAVFADSQRDFEYLSIMDKQRYLDCHPDLSADEMTRKRFQLNERLAMPWACLILTLFAVPAGTRTGRQGVLGTVFTAIILMVVFYATAQLGVALGTSGRMPPVAAAWLANGVCGAIGLYLLARVR